MELDFNRAPMLIYTLLSLNAQDNPFVFIRFNCVSLIFITIFCIVYTVISICVRGINIVVVVLGFLGGRMMMIRRISSTTNGYKQQDQASLPSRGQFCLVGEINISLKITKYHNFLRKINIKLSTVCFLRNFDSTTIGTAQSGWTTFLKYKRFLTCFYKEKINYMG